MKRVQYGKGEFGYVYESGDWVRFVGIDSSGCGVVHAGPEGGLYSVGYWNWNGSSYERHVGVFHSNELSPPPEKQEKALMRLRD